jgi:hypothetical protein
LILLVTRPRAPVLLALACVPIGTLLGTAFVESAYDRYSAPLIPFLVAVAVGGIARVFAIAGRWSGRRSAGGVTVMDAPAPVVVARAPTRQSCASSAGV